MVIAAPGTPCESVFLTLAMSPISIGWSGGGWWDEGGKWQDKRSKCLSSCLHTHTNTLTTCLAVGLFVDAKGRDPLSKHRCWSWSSPVDVSIQTHTYSCNMCNPIWDKDKGLTCHLNKGQRLAGWNTCWMIAVVKLRGQCSYAVVALNQQFDSHFCSNTVSLKLVFLCFYSFIAKGLLVTVRHVKWKLNALK